MAFPKKDLLSLAGRSAARRHDEGAFALVELAREADRGPGLAEERRGVERAPIVKAIAVDVAQARALEQELPLHAREELRIAVLARDVVDERVGDAALAIDVGDRAQETALFERVAEGGERRFEVRDEVEGVEREDVCELR